MAKKLKTKYELELKNQQKLIDELGTFHTLREMHWYIKGLQEAKQNITSSLDVDIDRYLGEIPFTDLWDKEQKQTEKDNV